MAARWNWWLGHAMATRTFTSRSSKSEVAFFIDDTLDSGCWNDRCVRRDLECTGIGAYLVSGTAPALGPDPGGRVSTTPCPDVPPTRLPDAWRRRTRRRPA